MLDPKHPYYTAKDGTDLTPLLELITCNDNRLYQPMKYLFRAGRKPVVPKSQDLRKALWWIDRLLKHYIEHDEFIFAHWPYRSEEVDQLLFSFSPTGRVKEIIVDLFHLPTYYNREDQKLTVSRVMNELVKEITLAEYAERLIRDAENAA